MKITLSSIVAEFLESADQSSHQFRRLYNIGVRGCREFNMDILGGLKTELLDVNANKSVSIPDDYITYSKIGIINDKGEVVTFTRNEQMSNYHAMLIDVENRYEGVPTLNTGTPTTPATFPYVYYNYWMNGGMYNLFGLNSGTSVIDTFKIDEDAGVILLSPESTYTEVLLEYLSDGYDADADDYEIDYRAEEAFICYLRWKNATDLVKKFSQAQIRDYKSEYYRERKLAKMRINPVVISEMISIRRANFKLTAKA
jgi:hypothetical protein